MKLSGSIFVSTAILLLGAAVAHGAAILSPAETRVWSLREAAPRSPASFQLHPPLAAKYRNRLKDAPTLVIHRLPALERGGAVELNRFGPRRLPATATVARVEARESR